MKWPIFSLVCHGAVFGVLVEVGLVMLTISLAPTQLMTWHETPAMSLIETVMLLGLAVFEGYVILKGLKELNCAIKSENKVAIIK